MDSGMSKKFCYKCGTELDFDASFCPKCGERYNTQGTNATPPIQQNNMNTQEKAEAVIKKTGRSKAVPLVCLAIGFILFVVGLSVDIPSDYISSYGMTEYVGGDAYNFIIEASLRGGRIAAALISKCIYISVGLLISCMSVLKIYASEPTKGKK